MLYGGTILGIFISYKSDVYWQMFRRYIPAHIDKKKMYSWHDFFSNIDIFGICPETSG
jgi:hypothetical protein